MRGRSDSQGGRLIDRAARGAAAGMSRRELVRLGLGAVAAAALPAAAWPTAAAAAKTRGICPPRQRGTCPPGLTPGRWSRGAAHAIESGLPSTFNGCGPESGIRLPIFGRTDPVPDRPLFIADFFSSCQAHDCCYGGCGSDQVACDAAFLDDALKACAKAHPGSDEISRGLRIACNKVAALYHFAVASGGRAAWEAAQATGCFSCERCDADLLTDPRNCGTCGRVCPAGQACCLGECRDTRVDAQNCGACGSICASHQRCIGGQCIGCRRPEITCGTQCCNPKTHTCRNGVCEKKCPRGQQPCGGVCLGPDERCCEGIACPADQDCCFRTRESPDRGICCPPGTLCYGHPDGFASCKPL
ncbi:MAG TPA: hypothetical protein VLK58_23465 [Conexibacter sp.]|nr:hypothetical protein [Conexibacter sp.]